MIYKTFLFLFLAHLTQISWSLSTENCTIGGVELKNITDAGDPLIINQTLYDTSSSVDLDGIELGDNVTSTVVISNKYVRLRAITKYLYLSVIGVNEKIELSQPKDQFYYNFTILVECKGPEKYTVGALIPIHETNTYEPIFSKDVYVYTLFSNYSEDIDRLLERNPIIANDNDMSNTEVIFTIENNKYFDIQYGGTIPGSLNKNHSARLVPKDSTIILSEPLTLTISVTDVGLPRKSSNATLIFKTANINYPTFKESYYIVDYYANNSYTKRSIPEVEPYSNEYEVDTAITGPLYTSSIRATVYDVQKISIYMYALPEIAVYKYAYLVYTLTMTFSDKSLNGYQTKGNTTIIVELHP